MNGPRTAAIILALTMTLATGCPVQNTALIGPEFIDPDFIGPLQNAADFWPFAVGNYWLWTDPENTNDWYSKKVLKEQDVAGAKVYLVESTSSIDSPGSVWVHTYYIVHPDGIYRATFESVLDTWMENPDDLSVLAPLLDGSFFPGTLPYPAPYDENREYSLGPLADLAPFDRCAEDDPDVVNGGRGDFLVPPEHTVLVTHAPGVCGNGERQRIVEGCYARGIGPIVWPGWRRGTLVYAVIDGREFEL